MERFKPVVSDATTEWFLGFAPTPLHRWQVLTAQASVHEIFEANRFVINHIHNPGPAFVDGGEQGSSRIVDVDPVAELLPIPWTLTACKPLETIIEGTVRPMQSAEPQDADFPIADAAQELFAFQ